MDALFDLLVPLAEATAQSMPSRCHKSTIDSFNVPSPIACNPLIRLSSPCTRGFRNVFRDCCLVFPGRETSAERVSRPQLLICESSWAGPCYYKIIDHE